MRRPSWNKSQAIQQVISLKALLEPCDDSGAGALRKIVASPQPHTPPATFSVCLYIGVCVYFMYIGCLVAEKIGGKVKGSEMSRWVIFFFFWIWFFFFFDKEKWVCLVAQQVNVGLTHLLKKMLLTGY